MTKYFRTVIQVEVLSDGPYEYNGLDQLYDDVTTGDCSGDSKVISSEEVSAKKMAELLEKQGSDPSFLLGDDDDEAETQRRDEKNGLYGEHIDPCN